MCYLKYSKKPVLNIIGSQNSSSESTTDSDLSELSDDESLLADQSKYITYVKFDVIREKLFEISFSFRS